MPRIGIAAIQARKIKRKAKSKAGALKKLGRKLTKLRKAKGLTRQEVRRQSGIYIDRIEKGTENAKLTTLIAIAKYYGISLSELLDEFN